MGAVYVDLGSGGGGMIVQKQKERDGMNQNVEVQLNRRGSMEYENRTSAVVRMASDGGFPMQE